ncbi:hypothetical protein [Kushneria aurantia]|uniref:EF-hand domain-containing protein n=1 Tax=Kushneria aurantia TaxID=504092 RepID=A0ABV6G0R0_9GAMM|nr:hypothetical protein [Kushneria aurantia]
MRKEIILGLALALGSTAAVASSFDTLDSNGDGSVSKDEFYGSIGDWGTYSDWDTTGDGLIDEDEFDTAVADWDSDWTYDYDTWDVNGDGYLDSGEFYDGIYTTWDANEDGHWQNGEWDDAGEAGVWDT